MATGLVSRTQQREWLLGTLVLCLLASSTLAADPISNSYFHSCSGLVWTEPLEEGWGNIATSSDATLGFHTIGTRIYAVGLTLDNYTSVWEAELENDVIDGTLNGTLLEVDDHVVVGTNQGNLYVFRAQTGELVWSVVFDANVTAASGFSVAAGIPLPNDTSIIAPMVATIEEDRKSIVVRLLATGDEMWRKSADEGFSGSELNLLDMRYISLAFFNSDARTTDAMYVHRTSALNNDIANRIDDAQVLLQGPKTITSQLQPPSEEEGTLVPDNQIQDNSESYSLSFWVKITEGAIASQRALVHKGNTLHRAPSAYIVPGALNIDVRGSTDAGVLGHTSQRQLVVGDWTHVCIVLFEGRLELYFDGIFDSQDVRVAKPSPNDEPLYIGNTPVEWGSTYGVGTVGVFEAVTYIERSMSEREISYLGLSTVQSLNPFDGSLVWNGDSVLSSAETTILPVEGAVLVVEAEPYVPKHTAVIADWTVLTQNGEMVDSGLSTTWDGKSHFVAKKVHNIHYLYTLSAEDGGQVGTPVSLNSQVEVQMAGDYYVVSLDGVAVTNSIKTGDHFARIPASFWTITRQLSADSQTYQLLSSVENNVTLSHIETGETLWTYEEEDSFASRPTMGAPAVIKTSTMTGVLVGRWDVEEANDIISHRLSAEGERIWSQITLARSAGRVVQSFVTYDGLAVRESYHRTTPEDSSVNIGPWTELSVVEAFDLVDRTRRWGQRNKGLVSSYVLLKNRYWYRSQDTDELSADTWRWVGMHSKCCHLQIGTKPYLANVMEYGRPTTAFQSLEPDKYVWTRDANNTFYAWVSEGEEAARWDSSRSNPSEWITTDQVMPAVLNAVPQEIFLEYSCSEKGRARVFSSYVADQCEVAEIAWYKDGCFDVNTIVCGTDIADTSSLVIVVESDSEQAMSVQYRQTEEDEYLTCTGLLDPGEQANLWLLPESQFRLILLDTTTEQTQKGFLINEVEGSPFEEQEFELIASRRYNANRMAWYEHWFATVDVARNRPFLTKSLEESRLIDSELAIVMSAIGFGAVLLWIIAWLGCLKKRREFEEDVIWGGKKKKTVFSGGTKFLRTRAKPAMTNVSVGEENVLAGRTNVVFNPDGSKKQEVHVTQRSLNQKKKKLQRMRRLKERDEERWSKWWRVWESKEAEEMKRLVAQEPDGQKAGMDLALATAMDDDKYETFPSHSPRGVGVVSSDEQPDTPRKVPLPTNDGLIGGHQAFDEMDIAKFSARVTDHLMHQKDLADHSSYIIQPKEQRQRLSEKELDELYRQREHRKLQEDLENVGGWWCLQTYPELTSWCVPDTRKWALRGQEQLDQAMVRKIRAGRRGSGSIDTPNSSLQIANHHQVPNIVIEDDNPHRNDQSIYKRTMFTPVSRNATPRATPHQSRNPSLRGPGSVAGQSIVSFDGRNNNLSGMVPSLEAQHIDRQLSMKESIPGENGAIDVSEFISQFPPEENATGDIVQITRADSDEWDSEPNSEFERDDKSHSSISEDHPLKELKSENVKIPIDRPQTADHGETHEAMHMIAEQEEEWKRKDWETSAEQMRTKRLDGWQVRVPKLLLEKDKKEDDDDDHDGERPWETIGAPTIKLYDWIEPHDRQGCPKEGDRLHVRVERGHRLANLKGKGRGLQKVVVELTCEGWSTNRTKVLSGTNPSYQDDFLYEAAKPSMLIRANVLEVGTSILFGRDKSLADVIIPVQDVLRFRSTCRWYELTHGAGAELQIYLHYMRAGQAPRHKLKSTRAADSLLSKRNKTQQQRNLDSRLALKAPPTVAADKWARSRRKAYSTPAPPKTFRLHIRVERARGLDDLDAYVALRHEGKEYKTRCVEDDFNPTFAENFAFDNSNPGGVLEIIVHSQEEQVLGVAQIENIGSAPQDAWYELHTESENVSGIRLYTHVEQGVASGNNKTGFMSKIGRMFAGSEANKVTGEQQGQEEDGDLGDIDGELVEEEEEEEEDELDEAEAVKEGLDKLSRAQAQKKLKSLEVTLGCEFIDVDGDDGDGENSGCAEILAMNHPLCAAAHSRLVEGDRITMAGGHRVTSARVMRQVLRSRLAGDIIQMSVIRKFDGRAEEVDVELGGKFWRIRTVRVLRRIAGLNSARTVIETEESAKDKLSKLKPKVGFKIENKSRGHSRVVEVAMVQANTPAEKAGVQVGDLVSRFDTIKLLTAEQFSLELKHRLPGEVIPFHLTRGEREDRVIAKVELSTLAPNISPEQIRTWRRMAGLPFAKS